MINVPARVDAKMGDAEGSGNVRVIVRVRPPNDLEVNAQNKNVVEVMNENVLVFDPKDASSPLGPGRKRRHRDIRKRRQKDLKFAFDHVFDCNSCNEEVFHQSTRTLVDGLLGGYNCSVFAYGATGAGKTHTMLGSQSQPGVIYHTMIHLYKLIADMSHEKTFDIAVSYLEVYNEQIRDLLLPRKTLPIREDPASGVVVSGLSLHKPKNAEELLYILQFGNQNRTQHPTDANAESSRSHAVFQVFIRQKDRTANISTEVRVAKMCLVDLAGSERATVTTNRGARLREGANINRSLLALGNVINSLADNKSKGYVPYRDSKLTRLLKDSLGGNCRTVMIAAVSPSHLSYEDTYNTLKYADRAKNIRLNMKKNVLNVDFHVSRYEKIVGELRREIVELKGRLQQCEGPRTIQSLSIHPELNSMREKLQAVFNARCALRDQQLQQETSARDIQWKLHCKHHCLLRASLLSQAQPEMVPKIQGVIQGLEKKLTGQDVQRLTLSQQLQDNTNNIRNLQSQAAQLTQNNPLVSQMLELTVQKQWRNVQLNDARHYVHHLRRLARAQAREAVASNTIITTLLNVVQLQHLELLSRPGPLAPNVAAGYQKVCQLVGQWGVSWADPQGQGDGEDVPFQINDIIDIPLLADSGVLLDRLPASGKSPCASVPGPVLTCPGRVINGQVMFSATPSASSQSSSALSSLTLPSSAPVPHTPTSTKLTAARVGQDTAFLALSGQPAAAPQASEGHSAHTDCGQHPHADGVEAGASSVTVHAGQTPNPKKVPLSKPGQDRAPVWSPTVPTVSVQPACPTQPDHTQPDSAQQDTTQPNHSTQYTCSTKPLSSFSSPHSVFTTSTEPHPPCVSAWSAAPQNAPVSINMADPQPVGNQPLARACHLPAATPVRCGGRVMVPVSDSATPHQLNETFSLDDCSDCGPSTTTHSTKVLSKPSYLSVPVIDASLPCPAQHPPTGGTGGRMSSALRPAHGAVTDGEVELCDKSRQQKTRHDGAGHMAVSWPTQYLTTPGCDLGDKENTGSGVHHDTRSEAGHHSKSGLQYNPQAKRAINFDQGPVSSPTVVGMSYADAVRTPTPPRKALQELNHNSPQTLARHVSTDTLNQTPKHRGRSSMYMAGPQTYENMQRLKQLGMPSLVESLIIGNKTAEPLQSKASRPSYMQSTKAHIQRVRHQTSFRDDNFHLHRVQHKTLAHSRSKSTSNLAKNGWKI